MQLRRRGTKEGPRQRLEVHCPAPLLEVLHIRDSWHLAALSDVPRLAGERPVLPASTSVVPDEAARRCEHLWSSYLTWQSTQALARSDAEALEQEQYRARLVFDGHSHPPPEWRSQYGSDDFDGQALASFASAARQHTTAAVRECGLLLPGEIYQRLGLRECDALAIEVLPLAGPYRLQYAPGRMLVDLHTLVG